MVREVRKNRTKIAAATLLYRGNIVSEDHMVITADERRSILGLFNVSEAARELGIPVRKMHWDITTARLPAPRIRLGKRFYFAADDLEILAQQCA